VEVEEDDIARRFPWYSQLIHEKLGSCHIAKRTARVMAFRVSVPGLPSSLRGGVGQNGRFRRFGWASAATSFSELSMFHITCTSW
jgi:hypothetical protein